MIALSTPYRYPVWVLYGGLAALFGVSFALGTVGISIARPAFILGCVAIGYVGWRMGPARHLEASIILFAFAPFIRRVVDLGVGYDPSSTMLLGPMLAILLPTVDLRAMLMPGRPLPGLLAPFFLTGACVTYAALLSLFQGDVMDAASGSLKWIAPLLYGIWMTQRASEDDAIVDAATRAFVFITPILGIYGVIQYVDPPAWDRYWMIYSKMTSIGTPDAYQVRVFSMMNSPATFATYAACGLLLFGFCRSGWLSMLMALPCSIGLLLSLYRTAWLALAIGIVFCMFFTATRRRAVLISLCIVCAVAVVTVATPFGDVITDRLETLGNAPTEDGSGQERIEEYITLYNNSDHNLFGGGFSLGSSDVATPGAMPIDGMIVACWLEMGIFVGLFCLTALIWAALQALLQVWRNPDPTRVVLGAIIVGALIQLPLAGIASSELGFLFWVFVAIATTTTRTAMPAFPLPRTALRAGSGHTAHIRGLVR